MKKFIALLMSLALLLSLAACSGDSDTDKDTDNDETKAVVNEDAEAENDDSSKPQTVSRGTIVGNTYKNDFAGISFEKPDDWSYMADEDLTQILNAGMSIMDLNEIGQALAKQATVYDMAAVDPAGRNSVMIVYENTMLTAYRQVSADEYIDLLKTQLTSLDEVEYDIGEVENATLGNTKFRKLTATTVSNGIEITQIYYVRECGKYIVGAILTSITTPVETMEAMFN